MLNDFVSETVQPIYRHPVVERLNIQIENFSEKKSSYYSTKSPDGFVTVDSEIVWGRRGEKWYFISCIHRRRVIENVS